ncbi:MAG: hypothetical protein GX562_00100, partial [Coriobacteriaceae bacterium]|nr:hypothetical protein [Coriobacteriaceae bacterium]
MTHKLFSSAFTRRTLLATGAGFGICWLGDSLLRGSTAYAVTAETQSLTGGTAPDRSPAVASDLSSLDTTSTLSAFDVDRGNPNYREYQLMQQAIIDEQAARDAGVFSDSLLNPIRPLAAIDALPRDGAISRFAAFSDTHMGYWGELGRNKTWHALETYQALAPDLDAMFLIGDVCTKNTWEEVNHFRDGILDPLPTLFSSRPPFHLLMGNHDFIDWNIEGFEHHYGKALRAYRNPTWLASDDTPLEEDYGQRQNTVVDVGGATVIKLCGTNQLDWDYQPCYDFLAAALERAAFEKPGHPIFVMAHHPVPGLMISDADDAGYYGEGTSRDLIALMAQYSQVIFMAGHTHNPLQIPTSIDTDLGFTAICTAMTGASLWYAWEELEETRTNTSQGLLVDVFADGSVRMYRIDLMTGNLMPHVWNISANTVALEEFSTIRRRLATDGPEFPADSMITFENQQDQVLATWPQATRYSDEQAEDFTFNYRYTAWGMKSGLSYGADDFMSDFYKSSLADTVTRSVAIDASDPCAINLQAINPYGVASTPLTTETPFDVLSLSGVDRFQTSAMISARSYESAQDIIIATGAEFADALTASGLAGLLDAPVLLTLPN